MYRHTLLALGAALVAALPGMGHAAYPAKPIQIVVPATPGGTSDVVARALAPKLQEGLGQPVVVLYKPGAGTNIGSAEVAKAAPDGYTLLINGTPLATNGVLYDKLPFDPIKDLAPIVEVAEMANVVTVHPSQPIHNMTELVAAIKAAPDKFSYGTPGAGSSGHLSGELLASQTGVTMLHVPYQGNAQATTDHVGGVLPMGFVNLPVALPFIKDGRLRALAVTSAKRSPLLPDVPTVAEALNLPDYRLTGWFGLLAPAGTPPDVIDTLRGAIVKALKDPAVRSAITTTGADIVDDGTSADFAKLLRDDTERLTAVLRKSGAAIGSAK